jgi:hyperosmotically inducible protein
MKTSTKLSCAVACALGFLAAPITQADPAYGATASDTKVVIQDSAIASSVKAQLAADRNGDFGHVRVDADDHGIVKLEGHVRTQDAADRAISIAKHTEGVREVRSGVKIEKDD